MITVTKVAVHKLNSENSKLLAKASVTLDDCFVVNDISVVNGEKGIFVAMPSKKNTKTNEFYDIAHPINTECRELINKAVMDEFNRN